MAARLARSPTFLLGSGVLLFWVLDALLWRAIAPHDPDAVGASTALQGPSSAHVLGTDHYGRDILSRVLAGAGSVLAVAPPATLLGVGAGVAVGLLAGYRRGLLDDVAMRGIDALLAFPLVVAGVLVLAVVGVSEVKLVLLIAVLVGPLTARTIRAAVLAQRERDYVAAARLRGESDAYVMLAEILPNVAASVIVEATVRLGYAVSAAATLSFLGLGFHEPSPDWGLSIALGRSFIAVDPWEVLFPALALASLVVGANLAADGLRRAIGAEAAPRRRAGPPSPRRRGARGRRRPQAGGDRLVEIADLTVAYRRGGRRRCAIAGVSLHVGRGEAYGLVGESGSGKTTVARALMQTLPGAADVEAGSIRFDDVDLTEAPAGAVAALRGRRIAIVPQGRGRALDPSMRIGEQIAEVLRRHDRMLRAEAAEAAVVLLGQVGMPDPIRMLARYPHELSGGQQQLVLIAIALAGAPDLLVLDEPTTGLDASAAAEVLDLVSHLRANLGTTILLISHDLRIVRAVCDRVGVLYGGRIVEEGPVGEVVDEPRHPYTRALLRCVPALHPEPGTERIEPIPGAMAADAAEADGCNFADRCPLARADCRSAAPPPYPVGSGHSSRCHHHDEVAGLPPRPAAAAATGGAGDATLLRVDGLRKTYRAGGRAVEALADVSLDVRRGEILGLVGETGSGKTTLARCVAGLERPSAGRVELEGAELPPLGRRARALRRRIGLLFQGADAALNPRHTARRAIHRAVRMLGGGASDGGADERIDELAAAVRLDRADLELRPGALSGGMRQRVAIARSLAGAPDLIVCDEPVSDLDVSVQAAILNVLARLRADRGVAYLFISQDLSVIRTIADRVGVLYLGWLVEIGGVEDVFAPPHHPYTEALLSAAPTLDLAGPERIPLRGPLPSASRPPSGCRFHPRCPRVLGDVCRVEEPPWQLDADAHAYRCHIPPDRLRAAQATDRAGRVPAAPVAR